MSKLYWVNGLEYVRTLQEFGYKWGGGEPVGNGESIIERISVEENSTVLSIDHKDKSVHVYPLEIYAPGSPTANRDKYEKITSQCHEFDELVADLKAAHGN